MKKIILALGGGGVRGFAHIGVLKVLEREGIQITGIAGTSMGGMLGALYAAGVPLDEIQSDIKKNLTIRNMFKLVDLSLSKTGLSMKGARILDLLTDKIGADVMFNDLKIPLAVITADLSSGTEHVISSGPVSIAVRATISIPGVFEPVQQEELRLVDGGIVNNLPVDVAKQFGKEPILAVDVMPRFQLNQAGGPIVEQALVLDKSPAFLSDPIHITNIVISQATDLRLQLFPPDLIIRPKLPENVLPLAGFSRAQEVIDFGEEAMEKALPALIDLFD